MIAAPLVAAASAAGSHISAAHFLAVSIAMFTIGLVSMLINRHAARRMIGGVLMLNAAVLNFVAFSRFGVFGGAEGQISAIFVLVVALIQVGVALAVAIRLRRVQSARAVDPTKSPSGKTGQFHKPEWAAEAPRTRP